MMLSPDISDCFNDTDITLEEGKEYIIYIASTFASSYPIVQLYSEYNPIFICAEDVLDAPKHNYITLSAEYRENVDNGDANFSTLVSESPLIAKLIASLKIHQKTVWIKTFKNNLDFQPLFDDDVKSLGLTSEQSHKWNDKIEQYRTFKDIIPIADFMITSKDEAVNHFDALKSSRGVVTSLPRNGQGEGVRVHANKTGLQEYLEQVTEDSFLIMKALSVKSAPSVEVLIANKDEIIVYGLVEQILEGVVCLGALYPTNLSQEITEHCYDIAHKVGEKLAEDGIRGIVGVDFIIDENDGVYFCELNARYTGATHNRMLALQPKQPLFTRSVVDLEMMAFKEGTFNGHQLHPERDDVFWYKKEIYSECSGKVRHLGISNGALKLTRVGKGAVIVGQRRAGSFAIKNKTSLGNLICMGQTKEELSESIRAGEALVTQYIPLKATSVDAA